MLRMILFKDIIFCFWLPWQPETDISCSHNSSFESLENSLWNDVYPVEWFVKKSEDVQGLYNVGPIYHMVEVHAFMSLLEI